ncbi:DUF4124 domain-containing protein [Pseudazoarcus pumilus]|uniref:DUF4124 domain-containing protein n=1 Tax=Pseudazoarcus pumilus TaxID=2067960 RepID=A0A2I6S4Y5_9RHOO|nr:DUF4124 domain-containing protein [Pseudazoarcus pumilus]AUN94303.1 DUF4124 domain-containing protein [Pseudazoarcus pumilus]
MTSVRKTVLVLVLACPLASLAQSTVYKCVDDRGRVTYTNDRNLVRGCKPLERDQPVSSVPAPPAPAPAARPSSPSSSQSFPRVAPDAQRARDDSRRELLQRELESEQAALEKARATLEAEEARVAPEDRNAMRDGRATINIAKRDARLEPFRNAVELHERNIEALQRELSRLP